MIISHKHRFIYIKTRKTASTSLEIALSRFCGPDDILTKFSDEDELTRQELGYPGPQNVMWTPPGKQEAQRLMNHTPARLAKQVVDKNVWNSYFKFTFERNPYDCAISAYYFSTRKLETKPALTDYLRKVPMETLSSWNLYTIDDSVVMDHIGRYEAMETELVDIAARIGLPEPIVLPEKRAKGEYRQDRRPYREVLSPQDRAIIEKTCRKEIDYFSYTW